MTNEYINENIGKIQYMVLTIFLSRSFLYGIGITNILTYSKYDTWLSVFIAILLGFIPIFVIMHLNKSDTNLFNLIKSKILKYIIVVISCLSFVILLNDFINFASITYLFNTPNILIALLFILPSIYIVNKGAETIGRSALFMFYISAILFFIVSFSLTNFIDINNLKPILYTDKLDILNASIRYLSYTILPIIILNIIPKNNNYKEYNKYLLIGYILSSISMFIIIIFTTTIYNYEYISLFNYPAYFTIKKIEYNFIYNPENILSFFFVIDYFFSILVYLYILKYYLKNELLLKEKSLNITFIFLTLLLTYISIILFKNVNLVYLLFNNVIFYIFITFILLFIIVSLISLRMKHILNH